MKEADDYRDIGILSKTRYMIALRKEWREKTTLMMKLKQMKVKMKKKRLNARNAPSQERMKIV